MPPLLQVRNEEADPVAKEKKIVLIFIQNYAETQPTHYRASTTTTNFFT